MPLSFGGYKALGGWVKLKAYMDFCSCIETLSESYPIFRFKNTKRINLSPVFKLFVEAFIKNPRGMMEYMLKSREVENAGRPAAS